MGGSDRIDLSVKISCHTSLLGQRAGIGSERNGSAGKQPSRATRCRRDAVAREPDSKESGSSFVLSHLVSAATEVFMMTHSENPSQPAPQTSSRTGEAVTPLIELPERYDLDLLTLQSIDSAILRGKMTVHDPRRLHLACSFVAAALREMQFATRERLSQPVQTRSLLA